MRVIDEGNVAAQELGGKSIEHLGRVTTDVVKLVCAIEAPLANGGAISLGLPGIMMR